MENSNTPPKKNVLSPSVYTIDHLQDPSDPTLYLHKDGAMARCPYQSRIDEQNAVVVHPCGNFCQFFNLMAKKGADGAPEKDGQGIATNKVELLLSCGAGIKLPIAKIGAFTE